MGDGGQTCDMASVTSDMGVATVGRVRGSSGNREHMTRWWLMSRLREGPGFPGLSIVQGKHWEEEGRFS